MDEKNKLFLKNTLYIFIGSIGSKLVSFIMLPILTRWLSVDDYGLVDLLSVYSAFLVVLVGTCISDAIFVYPTNKERSEQVKYFNSGFAYLLMTSFAFAIALFCVNTPCDGLFPSEVLNAKWYLYGMLVSGMFAGYVQSFCKALNKLRAYSVIGFVGSVFVMLFSLILIPRVGKYGYMWAFILSSSCCFLINLFMNGLYRYISVAAISMDHLKEMLKYSFGLVPNGIMWWLVSALNKPLLEANVGLYGVGIFAVSQKVPNLFNSLFSIIATSWQVSIMQEFHKDNYIGFYNLTYRRLLILFTVLTTLLVAVSPYLLDLLVDEKYREGYVYVPILTYAVFLGSMSNLVGANFAAVKRSKYYFYTTIWGAGISLLLNYLLIPNYGIWGAVISILCSQFTIYVARIYYADKIVAHFNLWGNGLLLASCFAVSAVAPIWLSQTCCIWASIGYVILVVLLYKKQLQPIIALLKIR